MSEQNFHLLIFTFCFFIKLNIFLISRATSQRHDVACCTSHEREFFLLIFTSPLRLCAFVYKGNFHSVSLAVKIFSQFVDNIMRKINTKVSPNRWRQKGVALVFRVGIASQIRHWIKNCLHSSVRERKFVTNINIKLSPVVFGKNLFCIFYPQNIFVLAHLRAIWGVELLFLLSFRWKNFGDAVCGCLCKIYIFVLEIILFAYLILFRGKIRFVDKSGEFLNLPTTHALEKKSLCRLI